MTTHISRRQVLLGGTGLLGAAAFLAACGQEGSGSATEAATTSSGEPVVGGELRFAIGNDPATLNPQGGGTGNDTRYVNRQLFDSLLWQDPATGELQPWLAESWESNDDSTQFTFTLREGVTFSDDSPLTAQVVLDNFDDIIANGASASNAVAHFAGYTGGKAIDERTFTVTFEGPSIPFLQATADVALAPLAPASLAKPFEERVTAPIGTGPFVLDHYTPNSEVVLLRRTGYAWPPAPASNKGEAYLDQVTFLVLPEASVRTGAISSDQADVIGGVPPQDEPTLSGSGFPIVKRANPGVVFGLTPYAGRPLLEDLAVRQAFSLALDRTALRDAALNDSYAVATSVLSSTTPGWSDQSTLIVGDPTEAASVLEKAGWVAGDDGIRAKDGTRLSLILWWVDNFVANSSAVELVQAQAKEIGIEIQLETGDFNQRLEAEAAGEIDLAWGNLSRSDPDILRTQFAFTDEDVNQPPDEELNALLEQQRGLTGDERNAVVDEAVVRILEQVRYVPVFELTTVLALESGVQSVVLGADSRLDSLVGASVTS